MVKEVFISFLEFNNCIENYRDECGRVGFCVPIDKEIIYNWSRNEQTDFDSLVSNYANTITITADNCIQTILSNVHYQRVKKSKKIRAVLYLDDIVYMNGYLLVSETTHNLNSGNKSYKILFLDQTQLFKDRIRAITLDSIDLGEAFWDYDSIINLRDNNAAYQANSAYPPIYPALVNFGKWLRSSSPPFASFMKDVCVQEILFVVYLTAILEKSFCQAGYKLKSNYFQNTQVGLKTAILGQDLLKKSLVDANYFKAETTKNTTLFVPILITSTTPGRVYFNSLSGSSNVFSLTTSEHTNGSYVGKLIFSATVDLFTTGLTANNTYIFSIYKDTNIELASLEIEYVVTGSSTVMEEVKIYVITDEIKIQPSDVFYVRVKMLNSPSNVDYYVRFYSGAFFENEISFITPYQLFNISSYLKSISLEKILSDLIKVYPLRILVSESKKEVVLEPDVSDYILWNGERQIGFINGFIDITQYIDTCIDIVKKIDSEELPRYKIIRFKDDSNDVFPETQSEHNEETGLYGLKIDFGQGKNETEKIETSVIAETGMGFDKSFTNPLLNQEQPRIYIPHIWSSEIDKETGDLPDKINKFDLRLVYVFGAANQIDPITNSLAGWIFEGVFQNRVPLVLSYYPYSVMEEPIPNGNIIQILENTTISKDGFKGFYQIFKSCFGRGNKIPISIGFCFNNFELFCLGYRKKVVISSEKFLDINGNYDLDNFSKNILNKDSFVINLIKENSDKQDEGSSVEVTEIQVCDYLITRGQLTALVKTLRISNGVDVSWTGGINSAINLYNALLGAGYYVDSVSDFATDDLLIIGTSANIYEYFVQPININASPITYQIVPQNCRLITTSGEVSLVEVCTYSIPNGALPQMPFNTLVITNGVNVQYDPNGNAALNAKNALESNGYIVASSFLVGTNDLEIKTSAKITSYNNFNGVNTPVFRSVNCEFIPE